MVDGFRPLLIEKLPAMIDFFEFSNEMLCVADERGYFIRVNQAWTKSLGWSAEELTSRPYIDFVHPDDLEATRREAYLLLNSGHETIKFENRYRCRDGSYRWLAWRVRHEPGLNQLVATARDVTDEKLQAEALRQSEQQFRSLATHAPIGIAQSDPEGSIFFVNSKWCDLAGVTRQETMGLQWKSFVHPDDLEGLLEVWQSALWAGRNMPAYEFRFLHKNGDIRWASSSISMLKSPDGRITGQIATIEDITNRKAAEHALRTKESQLRGILDNTSAVIYLKDLEGRYLLVNRRHRLLFSPNGEDIVGKTVLEIHPDSIACKMIEADRTVIEEQAPIVCEETAIHDDGPHIYRSIKFPVKDHAGDVIAVGGISTDISDLKEAHEALKKKEELLRNMIEVQEDEKQFLCREFHDGLIQYAVGSLMLLESLQRSRSSTEDLAMIDVVIGNLRKGIEDGRRVIRGVRPAVLDDLGLKAAVEDLIDQFSTSPISVTCDCDPQIGRLPDSIQITAYRVVQEALSNAKKHSGADRMHIELKMLAGELCLEIRDSGCGFEVRSARKRGFGLRGMTERVRLLGGECTIESEQGAGTRVLVRLPIQASNDRKPDALSSALGDS